MKNTKTKRATERVATNQAKRRFAVQRMAMPLARGGKSPLAKARDEWLDSAEGQCCSSTTILQKPEQRQYLENRLVSAFLAGVRWMERQQQKGKRHSAGTLRPPSADIGLTAGHDGGSQQ